MKHSLQTALDRVKADSPYSDLARQIVTEYEMAWQSEQAKRDVWGLRLKLYNNQKRDQSKVGDTTMFSIHQTVLASLYSDRLSVVFSGREQGDEDVGDNLTAMAEYDYTDMQKDELDYDWDWDTCFFGRGLISLEEYIRDPKNGVYLPVPHIIDPIPFLHDPLANSVNGDRTGKGAARFMGHEVRMTRRALEENPNVLREDVNLDDLSFDNGDPQSLLQNAIDARQEAQGMQTSDHFQSENSLGPNGEYTITVWYTHYKDPKTGKVEKVKVWLGNQRSIVIGIKKIKHDYWPIIDRALYPHSHSWDGTSIADLTEDKQRARAVAANLGMDTMKADLYPMYIYDSNKISNRKDLNFAFNKFIPVDSPSGIAGAIEPLVKSRPNLGLLDFIYKSLDLSAQKATATSDIQQGMISEKKRTLGEINIATSRGDTRYSLAAKIFGWSERRFWRQWYQVYKDNFADKIDKKVIRLVGAFGNKWRPLMKKDISATLDPDVKIESQVLSRAKQFEERQQLTSYFAMAFQDPTANRRYGLKRLGRLNGMTKDEVERLFPPTIDERIAERENDSLNKNKLVEIHAEDDHNVHLEIHSKGNDTKAMQAHRLAHEKALEIKKVKPELFPQGEQAAQFTPPGSPTIGQPQQATPVKPSQTSGLPTNNGQ